MSQNIYIAGYASGLEQDKKPFLLPDQAFQTLENAYVWRDRVKKRDGLEFVGRLRRNFVDYPLGVAVAGTWNFNLYTTLVPPIVPEANAEIEQGTMVITIGAVILTDQGNGFFTSATPGNSGFINYLTGAISLTHTGGAVAATVTFGYFPGLPVMGIDTQEIVGTNNEQTIFFDTKYAYIFNGSSFDSVSGNPVWSGTDSDFFWSTNYRGITPDVRLFFTTNFVVNASNPMRYFDNSTWTDFFPYVDATHKLYQARILIPYYGRLLALNCWEGTVAGGFAGAVNISNRCRFSQIGNPLETTLPSPDVDLAWRSDLFGRGGFIDAPVNEAIITAAFFKNTLIVGFERSTWQLRYVGEYGLPFLWERISSDFGCESTFSTVLFDQGVLFVGDKAIVTAGENQVRRIDEKIPDIVFQIRNSLEGPERVQGIRDFQKELVYWCYADSLNQRNSTEPVYPDTILVYNYRNNTFSKYRDSITTFGTLQISEAITWSSTIVKWDDEATTWDDAASQALFPFIVSGNQQGFIHKFVYNTPPEASLHITAINRTVSPIRLTIPQHNLFDDEIVFLEGLIFIDTVTGLPVTTSLNGQIYLVKYVDVNTVSLYQWNGNTYISNFSYTPAAGTGTYMGGGTLALFPKMNIETKDFNPFQTQGLQIKTSYIDFLTDSNPGTAITVNLLINSTSAVVANLLSGNTQVESATETFGTITGATQTNPCIITSPNHGLRTGNQIQINNIIGMTQLNTGSYTVTYLNANTFSINIDSTAFTAYVRNGNWIAYASQFYAPTSDYSWHRFFATTTGQYMRIQMTYDDALMNNIDIHESEWVLDAISINARPGGKNIF